MQPNITKPANYSKIDHLGFVVKDLDKTIKFLSSIGIGPFTPPREDLREGKVIRSMVMIGDISLEIQQPIEGYDDMRDLLDKRGGGVDHIAFVVEDLEKEKSDMLQKGATYISSAVGERGPRAHMVKIDSLSGIYIQISRPKEK